MRRFVLFTVFLAVAFGAIGQDDEPWEEFSMEIAPFLEYLEYRGNPAWDRLCLEPDRIETLSFRVATRGQGMDRARAECVVDHLIKNEQQRCTPGPFFLTGYPGASPQSLIVLAAQKRGGTTDMFLVALDGPGCQPRTTWECPGFRDYIAPSYETVPLRGKKGALAFAFILRNVHDEPQLIVVNAEGGERLEPNLYSRELMDHYLVRHGEETAIAVTTAELAGEADCPDGPVGAGSCAEVIVEAMLVTADRTIVGASVRAVGRSGRAGVYPIEPVPEVDKAVRELAQAFVDDQLPAVPE